MNKKFKITLIISAIIIILSGILIYSFLYNNQNDNEIEPNMEEIGFFQYHNFEESIIRIVSEHNINTEFYPLMVDGRIYLPYNFLQKYVDRHIFWEPNSNRLSISKIDYFRNEMFRFEPNNLIYTINWIEFDLEYPILRINDIAYLPKPLVMEIYNINIEFEEEYNILIFDSPGSIYQIYQINLDLDSIDYWVQLRYSYSLQSPIAARLQNGQTVYSFGMENEGFLQIRLENGISGFVEYRYLNFESYNIVPDIVQNPRRPQLKPSFDGHINFLWQYVNRYSAANVSAFYAPLGVNVISPKWFTFDPLALNGDIVSLANHTYMAWARENNLEVWPMFTDNFNPNIARMALDNAQIRDHIINQIMNFIIEFDLDGINIDYESVPIDMAGYWIQFLREISIPMREVGAILSVATFVPMPWSMFWNRYEIGMVADYVIIMGYDEHYGFMNRPGQASGSTASFPFVLNSIINTIYEVPSYRVVIGLPTFVRIYREETFPDGSIMTNHHQAVGMNAARHFIESRGGSFVWDYINRQYYGEISAIENGNEVLYRLWLADLRSHSEKFALIRQYDLAGVAFWQKGLALPEMWSLLQNFID